MRNVQLYEQLESRNVEFQDTLASLENMKKENMKLTINTAGAGAVSNQSTTNSDLENKYSVLSGLLEKKNEEISMKNEEISMLTAKIEESESNEKSKKYVVFEDVNDRTDIGVSTGTGFGEKKKNFKVDDNIYTNNNDFIDELPSTSRVSDRDSLSPRNSNSNSNSTNINTNTNTDTDDNTQSSKERESGKNNQSPNNTKIPLNPFAEDTIKKLKLTIASRDEKLAEYVKNLEKMKMEHRNEIHMHSETNDDFEMRLAVLCDQLDDTRSQLESTKIELNDSKKQLHTINGNDINSNSNNEKENNLEKINVKFEENEKEKDLETEKLREMILHLETENNSLTRIGKELNKKIHEFSNISPTKKEEKVLEINSDINSELMTEVKNAKSKEKELNVFISDLKSRNCEQIETIHELKEKIEKLNHEIKSKINLSSGNTSTSLDSVLDPPIFSSTSTVETQSQSNIVNHNNNEINNEINSNNIKNILLMDNHTNNPTNNDNNEINSQNNIIHDSQYSTHSMEVLVPRSGTDYFNSQKTRNTDFLLIPFDRVNEMSPTEVLKLLISYKLEHASVSVELSDAKNEISRIKRINIMNAVAVPAMRKIEHSAEHSSRPHIKHGNNHNKYAEKSHRDNEKDRELGKSVKLSSSSISANAARFSSDVFKSTSNLLRMKTSLRGGSSVVGSVAESISTSLWGGSAKDAGEEWDGEGSENDGSVYSSHGSVCESHKKYVNNM